MTAQEQAAQWTREYFKSRGIIPNFNDWRQIYDVALGFYLK